jgi:uncharacterized protein YdhG (YjbR/CyaY superfamily)
VAKTDFKSVDEYIATHSEPVQVVLQRVRSVIRRAVPTADEVISYQMPAYKLHGKPVVFFAGHTHHYSLYAAGSAPVLEAFKQELAPYVQSKGTIRFPFGQPVPVTLIERIAKFRAREVAQQAREKAAARRR